MEPQHFRESPNHPGFPSTVLNPSQTDRSTIVYRFSTPITMPVQLENHQRVWRH